MKTSSKGILLILFSSLMFGSYGVWIKLVGVDHGIFYPGWTRSLLISIVLLPFLLYWKMIIPIKKEDWRWMAVFLFFTSLTQAPLQYANNHMDIGTVTLLYFVSLLITMYVIGFGFFKEKATKVKIISFIIALVGLYAIFSFSIQAFVLLATLMAILNGIASGGEIAFSKKITGSYSALYVSWLSWVFIFVSNLIMSLAVGETQYLPTFNGFWFYQIIYAIVGVLGFWAIVEALRYSDPSIAGLLGLLEIIFSIIFGIIIFGQPLTLRIFIGAVFIIIAAALPNIHALLNKGLAKSKYV